MSINIMLDLSGRDLTLAPTRLKGSTAELMSRIANSEPIDDSLIQTALIVVEVAAFHGLPAHTLLFMQDRPATGKCAEDLGEELMLISEQLCKNDQADDLAKLPETALSVLAELSLVTNGRSLASRIEQLRMDRDSADLSPAELARTISELIPDSEVANE